MKQPGVPHHKTRRKFDPAFKKEAVDLWLHSGKSVQSVAADLGVSPNRLYAWQKAFGQPAQSVGQLSMADLQKQLSEARRENEYLRREREILKKTLGILSEAPASASNGSRP